MSSSFHRVWIGVVVVNALFWFVFAFQPPAEADPRRPTSGPVDPAVQRAEMIRELSEIKQLLKEQNEILLSNKTKVNAGK